MHILASNIWGFCFVLFWETREARKPDKGYTGHDEGGGIINYRQIKSNEMEYWRWKCLRKVENVEDIEGRKERLTVWRLTISQAN